MKAAAFEYLRPLGVDEALAALGTEEDARVLAGGQSLVPLMALRLATPQVLVDITRCPELSAHQLDGQVLTVGAAATDRALERDDDVRVAHPLLCATLALIAHPEIRARGTVCGSLAHADPAAELPALLLATDGEVEVRGPAGTRRVPAADFFTGPFSTAVDDGELIVAAHLPVPGPRSGWSVRELARRRGDFAVVGVVCVLDVDEEGHCSRAAVSMFGVAGTPVRSRGAEEILVGTRLDGTVLDEAAAASFTGVDVLGDEVHASAAYRRTAGAAIVRRALREAAGSRVGAVA